MCVSYKEILTYRHNNARQTDIRTQPLTDARGLPEGADEVIVLVAVDDSGEDVVRICGCADCEEDYEEKGLKVEERCLEDLSQCLVALDAAMICTISKKLQRL
jgi:hypothetical protein